MGRTEVRLRILEVLVPTCSKAQLTDAEDIAKIASKLEGYVLSDSPEAPAEKPSKRGRPSKQPKGNQPVDPLS